jgi:hypothetical protein
MGRGEAVEIALPQSTHHALYMHVTPGARSSEGVTLDTRGGAELLHAMSGVAGLEELVRLEEPARRAGYSVLLRSPDPTLVLLPPEEHPLWISMECRRRHAGESEPYEFRVGGHRLHVLRVLERGGDARHERLTLLVADGRRFVVEHDRSRGAWYLHRVLPAERPTERSPS